MIDCSEAQGCREKSGGRRCGVSHNVQPNRAMFKLEQKMEYLE